MAEQDDRERLLSVANDAIKNLMHTFQYERIVYICLSVLSFILLSFSFILMIVGGTYSETFLISMFGSSGLVAASAFRVTNFLNKAFDIIANLIGRLQ